MNKVKLNRGKESEQLNYKLFAKVKLAQCSIDGDEQILQFYRWVEKRQRKEK